MGEWEYEQRRKHMATATAAGFESETMTITPALAREWLELNHNNRPINAARVESLRQSIADGTFVLTHQGIAFYGHFRELADGQHRLAAIVAADTPVEMVVSWGLTKEVVYAIDRGRPRSVGNVLNFIGMQLTQSQVATCRALWQDYHAVRSETGWKHDALDVSKFAKFCDHVAEAVNFALPPKAVRGLSHASVTAAIAAAWFTQDHAVLSRFKDLLHGGIGATESETSAIRLRDYLLTTRVTTGGSDARQELYFRACTALRAFIERRGLAKLYCRPDARFPIPKCDDID